jgi:magnesium-protoporphyrin O-methyltransferase
MDSYITRRGELETYFDRTAAETWAKLTSDAPVSRIRATVRAGRNAMRDTLLSWLPADLSGYRLLDAGCGTGALAVEAARRGADVVAIDLAANLVNVARERLGSERLKGSIDFRSGDFTSPALGDFDGIVAMDSLIHYQASDIVKALAALASRTSGQMLITFAPKTPLLATMHLAGKLFPKSDRSPRIEPVSEATLRRAVGSEPALRNWAAARTHRVSSGFYISQALELKRG